MEIKAQLEQFYTMRIRNKAIFKGEYFPEEDYTLGIYAKTLDELKPRVASVLKIKRLCVWEAELYRLDCILYDGVIMNHKIHERLDAQAFIDEIMHNPVNTASRIMG